jgi:hypothetical protein
MQKIKSSLKCKIVTLSMEEQINHHNQHGYSKALTPWEKRDAEQRKISYAEKYMEVYQ